MAIIGIDSISEYEPGKRMVGCKHVSNREGFFEDHFPNYPIYPGVMMLEGMTQTAAWFVLKETQFVRSQARLKTVNSVKFSKLVRPEADLLFHVSLKAKGDSYAFKGLVTNGDKTVAQATFDMFLEDVGSISMKHKHLEDRLNRKNKARFEELTLSGCKTSAKGA